MREIYSLIHRYIIGIEELYYILNYLPFANAFGSQHSSLRSTNKSHRFLQKEDLVKAWISKIQYMLWD